MFAAANIAKKADPVELCSLGRLFVVGGVLFRAQCLGRHTFFAQVDTTGLSGALCQDCKPAPTG